MLVARWSCDNTNKTDFGREASRGCEYRDMTPVTFSTLARGRKARTTPHEQGFATYWLTAGRAYALEPTKKYTVLQTIIKNTAIKSIVYAGQGAVAYPLPPIL